MFFALKGGRVIASYPDGTEISDNDFEFVHVNNSDAGLFVLGEPDPRPFFSDGTMHTLKKFSARIKLSTLDAQAMRPLRAIASGTDTQFDHDKLKRLEEQASELRGIISA